MAVQAFIDDSMDGDGSQVLVLAGYVANSEQWAEFSADWNEYLRLMGLKAFKMADLAQSNDENRWNLCGHLYRIIERHLSSAFAVAVEIAPLRQVVHELNLPAQLLNPYRLAFRALLQGAALKQIELGIEEPIDFVFDDRAEKQSVRDGFAILKSRTDIEYRHRFGAEPRFERDDLFPPLQAADMLAWIVRKHWETHRTITKSGGWEIPWRPMNETIIQAFAMNLDDADIRKILESVMHSMHASGQVGLMTTTVNFSIDLSWPPKTEHS